MTYRFSIVMLLVLMVQGTQLHAYRLPSGAIRYSSMGASEFSKAVNIDENEVEHLDSHELTNREIGHFFGSEGLKNLLSIGIANPSQADIDGYRQSKVPNKIQAYTRDPILARIVNFSRNRSLDPYFVMALVRTESNFQTAARSDAGAVGLMQMMPETASQVAGIEVTEDMLRNPNINLCLGTFHLRELLVRYRNPVTALSAWNAGEGAVQRYGSVPPYAETIRFNADVMRRWQEYRAGGKRDI